ncbi:predicted protein [Naegleria gruberi]|uniref:Predicted protein n=1 Tax=Naegleria gruberi TaxID=5762 RepID=D2W634_NAEGR|nr:uncharacterized protein NAEGRDRAFT_76877 [Naegleria gruberi]EFC35469.1 predicted protein [Naegleria gruberi]|eukprot:XP_002668213.1 predicted protein [Naegleria gruberi strain NEG-M]
MQEFFDVIGKYYNLTGKTEKPNHFFRNGGAQQKFRDMKQLNTDQAADHILSTAVFRTIVENYSEPKLTYDYYASIKTTMNQCWNFQTLSKHENLKKAAVEVELIGCIKDQKDCSVTLDVTKLIETIRNTIQTAIGNGKVLFAQSKTIRGAIDSFLKAFSFGPIEWDKKRNYSCDCDLCVYCRDNSKRWRLKYYVLYQNAKDPDDIKVTFEKMCLSYIMQKCFGTSYLVWLRKYQDKDITSITTLHFHLTTETNLIITERMAMKILNDRLIRQIRGFFNKKRKPKSTLDGINLLLNDTFAMLIPGNVKQVLTNAITQTVTDEWMQQFRKDLNQC